MDREVMHLRDSLIPKYAELVYNGFWFAPEREALQALVDESQRYVTGTVRLKLYKGNVITCGRKSRYSLYDTKIASMEGVKSWYNQNDATGFIRLNGLRLRARNLVQGGPKRSPPSAPSRPAPPGEGPVAHVQHPRQDQRVAVDPVGDIAARRRRRRGQGKAEFQQFCFDGIHGLRSDSVKYGRSAQDCRFPGRAHGRTSPLRKENRPTTFGEARPGSLLNPEGRRSTLPPPRPRELPTHRPPLRAWQALRRRSLRPGGHRPRGGPQ
jgi:hypothetical protein